MSALPEINTPGAKLFKLKGVLAIFRIDNNKYSEYFYVYLNIQT